MPPREPRTNIIRVVKNKDFTIISRHVLQDRRLSWAARGVFGYLLSKPDDWQVRRSDLQEQGDMGRDAILRVLKELETTGYLQRTRERLPNGKWDWTTTIYEQPCPEKPDTVEPDTVNQAIYKEKNKQTGVGATAPHPTPPIENVGALAPQEDHTAVRVFVEVIGRSPTAPQRKQIEATVTDLAKWRTVLSEWSDKGYGPFNITDMLDVYEHGWGSKQKSTTPKSHNTAGANPSSATLEALKKLGGK